MTKNYLYAATAIFTFFFFILNLSAQNEAIYSISVTTHWNSTDHSDNGNIPLPGSAHWSNLVGATHNTANEFFEVGSLASAGIEDVAEVGVNTDFLNEVNTAISNGDADQWLQQPFNPFAAISTANMGNITVNKDYPLLTLVSMIAPSPDWFIGINSFSFLDDDDNWKTGEINIDLFAYDAGTEDGSTYTTTNVATNPHENISSITNVAPFNDQKLATITITLISVLSLEDDIFSNTIKLSPNPVIDELRIVSSNNTAIKTVEIYNALGKLVNTKNDTKTMDLSQLTSGIYFAKIIGENGEMTTQKIIKN